MKKQEQVADQEFIELIARVCHNVNRVYCMSIGDDSQPEWNDAPDWQKDSARNGVRYHLDDDVTPEQSHESWLAQKEAEGWVYGDVKDPEQKTHPCMVPYNELPAEQQVKDHLFKTVIDSFKYPEGAEEVVFRASAK